LGFVCHEHNDLSRNVESKITRKTSTANMRGRRGVVIAWNRMEEEARRVRKKKDR